MHSPDFVVFFLEFLFVAQDTVGTMTNGFETTMQHSQLHKQRFNKKTSSEACLNDTLESAVIEWRYSC